MRVKRPAHHRLNRPGSMSLTSCGPVGLFPPDPGSSAAGFCSVWCFLYGLVQGLSVIPMQPTSTGQTIAFLPRCSASKATSAHPSQTNGVLWTVLNVLDCEALAAFLFVSIVAARHSSTWLCLRIPACLRLILQPVRMRVAGVEHSGQDDLPSAIAADIWVREGSHGSFITTSKESLPYLINM